LAYHTTSSSVKPYASGPGVVGNSWITLVFSLWVVVIAVIGLKRILGVPAWLGILLSLLAVPVALPFAIMFMRSPM
jgi:hypothetical protein